MYTCSYSKNVHNLHKHRNPKNTKHWRLSFFGSGTKLFITFLSLRFFDMRRETHTFFICWLFHLTSPRSAPRRKLLVWPRLAPKINFLPLASNLNSQSFLKSPNPQPIASRHDVIHIHSPIYHLGFFYCDICDCHILPARMWTPALNVCT